MPISALAAAKHICERSGWTISNLKLQKILYMSQMAYMGENNGKPLFSGQFEAWNYGPVEPRIYRTFSRFGRSPIENIFWCHTEECGSSHEIESLNRYTDSLLKFSAPELVSITHWEHGAWAKHYKKGVKGISIPNQDIFEEYCTRVRGK